MEVVRDKINCYYVFVMDINRYKYLFYVLGGGYVFSVSFLFRFFVVFQEVFIILVEDVCFGLYMQYIGIKLFYNSKILLYVFCDGVKISLNERLICYLCDLFVLYGIRDIF